MPGEPTHLNLSSGSQLFSNATNNTFNGGNFHAKTNVIIDTSNLTPRQKGLDLLEKHIAPNAFHKSAQRCEAPRCHPETRQAIQEKIMVWVNKKPENLELLVLWLYGPAGAGKSAIAQTIAELCEKLGLLAASFFFSRTAEGCSDSSRLVATLAWQLINLIPEIRETVLASLESDPTILSLTPAAQMKALIIDPLNKVSKEELLKRPRFVIIDGLDECLPTSSQIKEHLPAKSQLDILKIVSDSLHEIHTPLYFLIASRPNREIREKFTSFPLKFFTHPLSLEDDPQSTDDIRSFLTSSFDDMRRQDGYLPRSWPREAEITALVEKASGQFIYADTVIRYVRGHHGHEERLKTVLNIRPSHTKDSPFAMLDALLHQIFQSVHEDKIQKIMEVLGALIFIKKFQFQKLSHLEPFFDYRPRELASVMGDILSLVDVPENADGSIKIYHASLPDFLQDRSRSKAFYLDPSATYVKLARRCTEGDLLRRFPSHETISPYAYLTIYVECINRAIFTRQLGDLLLSFSIWTATGDFQMIFDPVFGEESMNLMGIIRQEQAVNPTWAQVYRKELKLLDTWIYNLFSSAPQGLQALMPAVLSLGSDPSSDSEGSHRLLYLFILSTFSAEIPNFTELSEYYFTQIRYCDRFVKYISKKIRRRGGGKFRMTDSLYAEFSLWCAKYVFTPCEPSVTIDGKIYGLDGDIKRYFCLALKRSRKSQDLVDFLKNYASYPPVSEYIQRCERHSAFQDFLQVFKNIFV